MVGSDEVVAVVGGVGDGQWVGEVAIVGNVVFLVSSFLPAVLVVDGGLIVVVDALLIICVVDVVKDCVVVGDGVVVVGNGVVVVSNRIVVSE